MTKINLSWEFYPAKKYFKKFSFNWDQLNFTLCNQHPLLDSRFIQPIIDCFGDNRLTLAILRSSNEIISAILIQRRNMIVWSTYSPSQLPITPMLLDRNTISVALPLLIKNLPGFCLLLEILHHDFEFCFINKKIMSKYCTIRHYGTTTRISCDFEFERFWSSRPKKLRENIRRYFKRLKSSGDFSFNVHRKTDDIKTGLICYGEIESLGWKGAAGTSIHRENIQGEFYEKVLRNFSVNKEAYVFEIFLKDKILASRIAIQSNNSVVMLKTTYLESFKDLSPGKLLLYLTLEYIFKNCKNAKNIEFYTNAKKEQLSWATETREIRHINFFRNKIIKYIYEVFVKIKEKI